MWSAAQDELNRTSAWPGICVKSEDFAQSGPSLDICVKSEDFAHSGSGPDSGATHNDTVVRLPGAGGGARQNSNSGSNGEGGICVKSEDFAQSGPSLDPCVKSEDFAQSGPGPDSGATHPGMPHKHLLAAQVVDIFKHKAIKNDFTSSILAAKYGVRPGAIRDIWNFKTWVQQTSPYWTDLDRQESLASGTRVESKNSTQSGPRNRRLTDAQVVDIFKQRTIKTNDTAALLAREYGVGASSIRDIWNLKTWAEQTRPHWTPLEQQQEKLAISDRRWPSPSHAPVGQ